MAGEQPPPSQGRNSNKSPNKKPKSSEKENWQESYYQPEVVPPPAPLEPPRPSTWRPNAHSTGKPMARPKAVPPASNNAPPTRSRPVTKIPGTLEPKASARNYQPLPAPTSQSKVKPEQANNQLPTPPRFKVEPEAKPTSFRRPGRPKSEIARAVVDRQRSRRNRTRTTILYGGAAILVVGLILVLFVVTRLTSFLSGISVPRLDQSGSVVANSGLGGGRVNVLLMGLDTRKGDREDGTRSDTMIVVSIDQGSKSASMLSIPRDLWVEIPGHGNNRINASYYFGDRDKPGSGGPPLAKATVSKLLGLSVDYFVQVDFEGFRQIINAIGGVTLDVKKPLVDNEFPTEDFGIKRIYIPAGVQHMDGPTALEYARSRHADSDLGRNQRQQAVLLAVREQGVNLGAVTNNQLQTALQGAIKTDLQAGDILGLVQTGIGMNKDNIRNYSIDANLTRQANVEGNDVLLPNREGIRGLVQQMTSSSTAAPAKETATISVLNGTFTQGRASSTQKFLEGKGYTISNVEQASDAGNYLHTIIRVYNGKQKTASELAGLLGLSSDKIQVKSGGPAGIDLEIVCGEDLKLPE